MALTLRTDGSGAANLVTSAWWNEYYDLLTGAMTDQPVTLDYAPATSGSTPTLALKSNGNAPLATGYKSDGTTQAFSFTSAGDLSLAGALSAASASLGGTPVPVMTNSWGATRITVSNTLPTTGMVKGDVCIKTPFA